MKKFLTKSILLIVLLFVIDSFAGLAFSYMVGHAKGGDNGRNNYICDSVNADILVFGSSRAIHHYNPKIISDSLLMTCYNCGQDGNGSILNFGRLQLICQRYHPKVIIYDVMPKYDLLEGEDNHRFLGWLRAYYDRPGVADIFDSVDFTEKYKMKCQMYRYNTKFIQVVSDFLHPIQDEGYMGFRPLNKEMDIMKVSKNSTRSTLYFDSLKIEYLKKIISLAESMGSKIVFVVSPIWRGMDSAELKPIEEICRKKNVPYLDYSNNTRYVHNDSLSCDGGHLNGKGADEFTKKLIDDIMQGDCNGKISYDIQKD